MAIDMNASTKKIIVVVDDAPADLELMGRYIKKLGYCPKCFPGGEKALTWLRDQKTFPYLILCDLRMNGGMNGFEFAKLFRKIKDSDKDATFVGLLAYTGYISDYVMKKAKAAGFDGCIAKPPSAATLAQQLKFYVRP